jgi:hypothetical protein
MMMPQMGWPPQYLYGYPPPPPSWPGLAAAPGPERQSSPVGENDDAVLIEYFEFLKASRSPARAQELQLVLDDLQEQGFGYSQLLEVPEVVWAEISISVGLKSAILRGRQAFKKHRKRVVEAQKARQQSLYEVSSDTTSN